MAKLYYLTKPRRPAPVPQAAWENGDSVIAQVQSFIHGILADAEINPAEAAALHKLLKQRSTVIKKIGFPLTDLMRRVDSLAEDGIWTPDELLELQQELEAFSAADSSDRAPARTADFIFCNPPPEIIFPDHEFVITGQFAYGSRNQVIAAIEDRGGLCKERPRRETHYVVVGSFVSEGWAHGSYGRKIEHAMEVRGNQQSPFIIREETWREAL